MQLAFGSAVILLLLSGLAAYDAVVRLRAAQEWVSHTRDVQSGLADLNSVSSRAGRARTRYVDSGDDNFLQEYQSAAAEIPTRLRQLRQLTADNPEQQGNWTHLEGITNLRFSLLDRSVQLKRGGSRQLPEQARLRQQIIDVSAEADVLLQKM
jgi:CHASE3 domain sensor protein